MAKSAGRKSSSGKVKKAAVKAGNKTPKATKPLKVVKENGARPAGAIKPFLVVGIGASAGGLEALEQFFGAVPPKAPIAFVVVTHQRAEHHSLLPQLLGRATGLKVTQSADGEPLSPGRVYTSPPDKELRLMDGVMHHLEPRYGHEPPAPIDSFFASLAKDKGEWAVGVVLSGMGSDGSQGLRQIKGELGLALVQEPSTAKYPNMPERAIEIGLADHVLPPDKMPALLLEHAEHLQLESSPTASGRKLESRQHGLRKIFLLLQRGSGHDFSGYKQSTVLRRLDRRLKVHRLKTLEEYASFLQRNPQELQILQKELLINVTGFFRDPEAFEALREKALKPLLRTKEDGDRTFRAWVIGCSTGEEAYSLAILIREILDELELHCDVQIFATDLDKDALEQARFGLFPKGVAAELDPGRLKRFFTKENGNYRIKKEIRNQIIFAVQNTVKDPPFTKLDLISCRNVLIYMGAALQHKLLPLLHYSLKPDGILFLGSAETVGPHSNLFATLDKKWKIFGRKTNRPDQPVEVEFPISVPTEPARPVKLLRTAESRKDEPNLTDQVHQILLRDYVPSSVLIDRHGDIYYFHGRTGRFLEPPTGQAVWNIMQMARPGLEIDLTAAIRLAVTGRKEIVRDRIEVQTNGGRELVRLRVRPLEAPESMAGLLLVMFEVIPPPEVPKGKKGKAVATDTRVKLLEQELQRSRENLQTVVEELESSNEELKSTNEEFQSANEELQSTNEELESSREELQSLNEELVNVNSELQSRVEETARAYEEMRIFLNSLEVPTIFLDNEMRVRLFSESATRIAALIDKDVGRPLEHLKSHLDYPHMVEDARYVQQTLRYLEREVRTDEGHWYQMRILPQRNAEGKLEGVVLVFFDIDRLKNSDLELAAARQAVDFARAIVDTVREPLLLLDPEFKVTMANASFYRAFRETPEETVGRELFELGERQWDIPELRKLLGEILPSQEAFEGFEVEQEFPGIGRHRMILNGRRLRGIGEERILLAIEEAEVGQVEKK